MPRRARITLEPTFSLGWELEATHGSRETPASVIRERDGSVAGQGIEYKIAPEYVTRIPESLEALRTLTADNDLHVDRSCGFHVHIGLQGRVTPIQRQQWAGNFVLLARSVEETAFSSVPESRRSNNYCRRWTGNNDAISTRRYSPEKYGNSPFRYQWVNIVEMFRPGGIGTVEIRLLGSTKRYAYLLAWIAASHAMAKSAWRMIADPTLLQSEANKLNQMFAGIRDSLLRPSSNQVAYTTAVQLFSSHVGRVDIANEIDRLVCLANACENGRRIRNVGTAHTQALAIEMDNAHGLAHIENNNRIESERIEREHYTATEREERRQEIQRGRSRAERLAVNANLIERMPVAVVSTLEGFNPEHFLITPTNGAY
jgi:hypothetical protein